ncbi:MAG: DUF433 domain-containing protein [Alphaproteobacteria bacterium]|nr:DUF433 domain-containing protein [Alphaproteobacteria bacterium]
MTGLYFTFGEIAEVSGVTQDFIEESVDACGLVPVMRLDAITGERVSHLPFSAVIFFSTLQSAGLYELPIEHKRSLWELLSNIESERLVTVELVGVAILDLPKLVGKNARQAIDYNSAKIEYLVSDPKIMGGAPVIRGTRITCQSVSGRLAGGDTIDDLIDDYPSVPEEAFRASDVYFRSHPACGRSSNHKW